MDSNNYAALLVMMLMALSCTVMLSIFYIWLRYTDEQESRRIDKILERDPEEY
jgi:Na+-transporting NADH:ubiquinone oxidoreductase subunit NqrC